MKRTKIKNYNPYQIFETKQSDNTFVFLLKYVTGGFFNHKISQTAAALSYFLLLSFFPFLIFINAIVSSIGIDPILAAEYLNDFLPTEIISIIETYLRHLSNYNSSGFLLFGFILAVYSISRAADMLVVALNRSYGLSPTGGIIRNFILSFVFTIIITVFLMILLAIVVLGKLALDYLWEIFHFSTKTLALWQVLRWWIVVAAIFLVILFIFLAIPLRKKTVSSILPGTVFSFFGVLFMSFALSFYFDHVAKLSLVYGALGAAVVLMLWLYFMSMVVVLGGEVNAAFKKLSERKYK